MLRPLLFVVAIGTLAPFALASSGEGEIGKKWTLDFEFASTTMPKNNVAIPGAGGTPFAFRSLTGEGPFTNFKAILLYEGQTGPGWRLFLAPFRISGVGRLSASTQFEGFNFAPGVDTEGIYRFNSWRVTYRNRWNVGASSDLRVGFTLKVRDAEVTVRQGSERRSKKDVGVVPLLHLAGSSQISDAFRFEFDIDGAAAPQGRAVDLALRVTYDINPNFSATLGWRTLEGGADNDTVFNFTQFNSVTLGVRYRF
ncbi:MAG: hypothetical protein MUC92_01260 [Fimbriimonadaceae bacterium]|jgi:hypothetical protein|nr:hypothetical protein [Fimbriimonadaceae bacterium]